MEVAVKAECRKLCRAFSGIVIVSVLGMFVSLSGRSREARVCLA